MFKSGYPNKDGFHIKFKNGWTVSIQFGRGNYCQNRDVELDTSEGCPDAEMAAWDKDGTWYDFGGDQISGYNSPEEVAEFINMISGKEKTC